MTQDERSKMEIAWADRRCDTVQRDGFVDGWTAAYAEVADLKRRALARLLRSAGVDPGSNPWRAAEQAAADVGWRIVFTDEGQAVHM
jgi:hypothetical protein